jgi:glycosyltransferase involved in cell wall biosynthesis
VAGLVTDAPPTFCVVVPAYQAEATLSETLDGVLSQTYDDWECVVVDDGSTDDTFRIASEYAARDRRIRVIHQANTGSGGAYNTAIRATKAPWIVLCSADDYLLPNHLATMSAFMAAEPGYQIYTSNGYIARPGKPLRQVYVLPPNDRVNSRDLAAMLLDCFFGVGATFAREIFFTVDGFREHVFAEDYDFWLRTMVLGARHRYTPEPLSVWRVSPTQKSSDLVRVFKADIDLITDLTRRHELSEAEMASVRETLQERREQIAAVRWKRVRTFRNRVRRVPRRAARAVLVAVIGAERTSALKRVVLRAIGRSRPTPKPPEAAP